MKRNMMFFRPLLSRLYEIAGGKRQGLGIWLTRTSVVAVAVAAMVVILPRSKAATQNQSTLGADSNLFQDGKVPSRVGVRLSSAVSGFEDKTVRNSLLPTKKYQVKFVLTAVTHELAPVDQTALANMKMNQIGIKREVNIASNSMGRDVLNADGTHIRILAIRSAGADSLRVHLEGLDLAAGDLVYVYGNAENSHVAGPYTGKGPFKSGDVWTDTINGDTAIIEYYFEGSEHPFNVSELTHTLAGRKQAVFEPAVKQCELDERCFNDIEKDAVGRIDFVTGQGEFVCSGTLLNDQPGDGAPFFLTAAHCLSTQSEAQTLEVWWFYQTTSCDSGVLRSDVTLSQPTGSNLLATDPVTDATLLSITGNIPSGVVFAGYDPAPQSVGTQVFGMHHPDGFVPPDIGSYLRHTNGTIELTNDSCDGNPPFNAYEVVYNQGLTEPGSSGSGIFVSEQGGNFLVGTLTCGTSPSCRASAQNLDDFHKFSDFYPQIQQFLTQGSGGGGGAGPVVASLTASLNGNILTLSGTATDTSAAMTSFDVNLVDQSGTTVDSTGQTAFNFGAGPTDSFSITLNNLNQFPSAVAAALVITDSSGHSNRAFVASFTHGDGGGPSLNSISYDSIDGILVIKGGVFDSAVQVEINGAIVVPPALFKVKAAGAKVKVFGFPATLNLNSGPNRIKVIDNGLRSNFLVLTL